MSANHEQFTRSGVVRQLRAVQAKIFIPTEITICLTESFYILSSTTSE